MTTLQELVGRYGTELAGLDVWDRMVIRSSTGVTGDALAFQSVAGLEVADVARLELTNPSNGSGLGRATFCYELRLPRTLFRAVYRLEVGFDALTGAAFVEVLRPDDDFGFVAVSRFTGTSAVAGAVIAQLVAELSSGRVRSNHAARERLLAEYEARLMAEAEAAGPGLDADGYHHADASTVDARDELLADLPRIGIV